MSAPSAAAVPVAAAGAPAQKPKKKPPPTPFATEPFKSFWYFLVFNLLAAAFAPIQDCDESFNYWEPTHYLSHGYALQTWEYSPEYAIRSWTYVVMHAIPANLRRLLPHPSKPAEFYFVRYCLAFFCSVCQARLFMVINNTINPRIALFFLMASILSPGMFHASAAYLPSSFAMYCVMMGMAAFMNWRGGLKTSQGIMWFAAGGILGWPFAMALSAPFLLEELIFACIASKDALIDAMLRFFRGIVVSLSILSLEVSISAFFYKKLEVVPLNIVLYNVFSGPGRGPEIYGTEPWHFYIRNLLLNFNIWFILAISALPLFTIQKLFSKHSEGIQSGLRTIIFMSPFYLWLAIFTLQPHKEERFMYPAYPCLALNAALSLHIILASFGNADPKTLVGKIPAKLKLLLVSIVLLLSVDIGVARIYGIYTAYSAPLKIYAPLHVSGVGALGSPGDSVCFGKDWYRFPTSFFLPNGLKAKFIKSEFNGLLPGEFAEDRVGFGLWPGTWLMPSGMNDMNQEDLGKYVPVDTCDFLVDTYYPNSTSSALEPHYVEQEEWEEVVCERFLDAGKTGLLARTLWVPENRLVPEQWRRKWGKHCLLRRRKGGDIVN